MGIEWNLLSRSSRLIRWVPPVPISWEGRDANYALNPNPLWLSLVLVKKSKLYSVIILNVKGKARALANPIARQERIKSSA